MKIHNQVRKKLNTTTHLKLLGTLALGLTAGSAMAGTKFWDFTTDPTLDAAPLQVTQVGFADSTATAQYWKAAGGNPGGFLGLCWPIGSSSSIILFPDIDGGKIVTAFKLEADLRVGNPQQADRAADGFSINFARTSDPAFQNPPPSPADFATSGAVETGTQTGISIIFDTWSGNTLPDGADIEGIIVRVDNVTVLRKDLATRNGACADPTSMQTGPRDTPYWDAAKATGSLNPLPDAAFDAASWSGLCWQPLSVEVNTNGQVTVIWKGVTVLDKFQTAYFPSAGALVLAGRTGGADEHTHFDNLRLTTTAITADTTPPTVPTNLAAQPPVGANHVILTWTDSTDDSGRVAYEVQRNGVTISGVVTTNRFEDFPPKSSTLYTYGVRAKDVSGNASAFATLPVTTAADTQVLGTVKVEIYKNIAGGTVGLLLADPRFPSSPDSAKFDLGAKIGNPNGLGGWNESFGDNLGVRVTGVLTPIESGDYNFFIRSDDGSEFYLNQTGAAIPDPSAGGPLIQEVGCCSTFLEYADAQALVPPKDVTTANPITLTAGQSYGFLILMKEGGGGDGVGVAMRKVGDPTPAPNVPMINPLFIKGTGDPIGAVIDITSQPASQTTPANVPLTLSVTDTHSTAYGNQAWYQWLRNGAVIPGATATNYVNPAVPAADNNAGFSVVIGVPGLVKTSSVATLTVTADLTKPTITSATADITFTKVTVRFSEPVTSPTATDVLNYTLDGGATVTAAALSADGFSVALTTSAQAKGTTYTLTVNNVQDRAANAIVAATKVKFTSWAQVLVGIPAIDIFDNISGGTVAQLTNDVSFPANPTQSFPSTNGLTIGLPNGLGGWNNSFGDNLGVRVTGVLSPPKTGQYHFMIRSDDSSMFFLNTNGAALPSVYGRPICQEDGCCATFQEPGTDLRTTRTPITLTAGQQYGYVVLMKEGGGGDGVGVAMRIVGDTTPAQDVPPINTYAPIPVTIPTLSYTRAVNGDLIITFQGTLVGTDSLSGTPVWTTVSTTSPATVSPTGALKFFRAMQ